MPYLEIIKIFVLTAFSFVLAFALTPAWTHILYKYRLVKNIRNDGSTPLFSRLHKAKAGTPVMGGVLIWMTVLILAMAFLWIQKIWPDSAASGFNFLTREETFLPLGALIASAFLVDFNVGVLVTIAVILHEIPQEISDFGVLLYAGLNRTKAILYNLLTALISVIGAVVFYFYGSKFENAIPLIIAFAAGNFIYLATADLIPELHHENQPKKIFYHTVWLLIGVLLVYLAGQFLPHSH